MGSKDKVSKNKDQETVAPAEQEYVIQQTLARYIDRKDLEKLLLKTFKKAITAYVSRFSHDPTAEGNCVHVAYHILFTAPQRCLQVYSLARADISKFPDSAGWLIGSLTTFA
jgi:hypothetical protein